MTDRENTLKECWEQVRKANVAIDLIMRDRGRERITEVQALLQIMEQNRRIGEVLRLSEGGMTNNKRVCLDPGHGGNDPGAVYRSLKEKDIVLEVAKCAAEGLQAIDPSIWVCLTRPFDKTLSLSERCTFANNMKVDCFVSIHCNADPDSDEPGMPEAKGEEIWFHEGSVEGMKLAQSLAGEVDHIFPDEPFRGIKQTGVFYVLKHAKPPACLLEIGFIDKSCSMNIFTDELCLRKIGATIARGIFEYLKKEV